VVRAPLEDDQLLADERHLPSRPGMRATAQGVPVIGCMGVRETSIRAKDPTVVWPYSGVKKIGYGQVLDPASI
jgi:hypothetical protein